jgi:ABC-type sugar transport system permease subunit
MTTGAAGTSSARGSATSVPRVKRRIRLNPAYAFIAPSALVLTVFTLWPIAQAFWMSLHDWALTSASHPFVGLSNYGELFDDRLFWNAARTTAVYTVAAVPFQIGLALGLAVALNGKIRGRAFLRSAYFIPVISSLAVMAIRLELPVRPGHRAGQCMAVRPGLRSHRVAS